MVPCRCEPPQSAGRAVAVLRPGKPVGSSCAVRIRLRGVSGRDDAAWECHAVRRRRAWARSVDGQGVAAMPRSLGQSPADRPGACAWSRPHAELRGWPRRDRIGAPGGGRATPERWQGPQRASTRGSLGGRLAGRWPNGGSGRTGRPRRCRAGTCRRGSSRWQRSWCGAAVSLAVGEASGSRAEPREGGGAEAPNQATRGGACACGCVDTCVRSARRACRHRSLSEHVLAEPSPRAAQARTGRDAAAVRAPPKRCR